jgi:starch synthase (maltosyl-transferring)
VTAKASIRSIGGLSKHRIYIEDVYPVVDGGRFPIKRIVGEEIDVWADIFRYGHAVLAAELLWRREGAEKWFRVPMALQDNDRWRASFTPHKPGRYVYAIEAWTDVFATWRRDFLAKRDAGMDVSLEVKEGRNLLADLEVRNSEQTRLIRDVCQKPDIVEDPAPLLSEDLAVAANKGQQSDLTRSATYPLVVDRPIARASAWYEMMPRSQSAVFGKHGTFDDCINRLPDIAAMGFDVLCLTPIHPIGRVDRKGRNNSLRYEPGDPGSPYAIGSAEGGHDAVHPELGTLDDFRRFVRACAEHRLEVALDFAVRCSPDHPWLAQHPEWFRRRPDGSIQYSENPPKKYEDIVNPDLYAPDNEGLWKALRDVVLFWVAQGCASFASTIRIPRRFRSGSG